MSASTITVNQGDCGTLSTLAFTLTDPDNVITTLAGYNIYLLVYTDPVNPIINGACVFDQNMQFHYIPTVTDFQTPGSYYWEIEIDGMAPNRLSGTSGQFIIRPSPTH